MFYVFFTFDFLFIKIIKLYIFLIKKKYIKLLILIIINLITYLLIKKYRNKACDNYFNGYGGYKLNNNKEEK